MQFEKAIEFAIVSCWDDLFASVEEGRVHVEYRSVSTEPVDYLRVWSVTRKQWVLICEYSSVSGLLSGEPKPRFANSFYSEKLARNLALVVSRQRDFTRTTTDLKTTVQICRPSAEDLFDAMAFVLTANHPRSPAGIERRLN